MKPFTTIAAVIFAIVSAGHILRLIFGWEVSVATVHIPMWLSVFGAVIPGALSCMLWRESLRK